MSDNPYSAPRTNPRDTAHNVRPRLWVKLSAAIAGFVLGIVTSVFVAGAFVSATYSCQPGPTDPCDAGGMVGFGLVVSFAPILGCIFSVLAYWLAARHERRRAA